MRRDLSLGFSFVVVCAVACAPRPTDRADDPLAGGQATDTAAIHRAIDSVRSSMVAAVNRQDMAGMAEGLAEDYVSLEDPTRPSVRGPSAYRQVVDSAVAAGTFHDLKYEPEGFDINGDLAVVYGRWGNKYLPKGGDTVRFAGHFVHVYRRQPDKSWKLAREISNSVGAAPALLSPGKK